MSTKNASTLPAPLIRQLGKRTDSELAREFKVSVNHVRKERRRRNIASSTHVEWTPKRLSMLGTMPDAEVARKLNLWTNTVFAKRVSLNIDPFNPSMEKSKFQWKAAHLKRLGKDSDGRIAKDLGISDSVVTAKRHSLGRPASRISVAKHPWTKQEIAMLGKKPDTVVAAATGRGRRHVRAKRESLGIPPFQIQRSIQWTSAVVRKLGKVSDKELAESLGVYIGTVSLYRRQKGIKSFGRGGGSSRDGAAQ